MEEGCLLSKLDLTNVVNGSWGLRRLLQVLLHLKPWLAYWTTHSYGTLVFTHLDWQPTLPACRSAIPAFPNGTHSTANLSQGCITALNAVINCDPYIQYLVSNDYYGSLGNATLQNSLCAAVCGALLALYHTNVALACASDPQPWPGIPAFWTSNVIWVTYNRTCLKDPATGAYCVGMLPASSV